MTEKQVIVCKVRDIRLGVGGGNHIILFEGDKITVAVEPNQRNRYVLFNSSGVAIGSLTKKSILWIQGKALTVKRGKHALAAQ